MQQGRITLFLLRFGFLFSTDEPQEGEQEEPHTGTYRASIVWPGRTQEPWVSVMSWRYNGNRGGALKGRPSTRFVIGEDRC